MSTVLWTALSIAEGKGVHARGHTVAGAPFQTAAEYVRSCENLLFLILVVLA